MARQPGEVIFEVKIESVKTQQPREPSPRLGEPEDNPEILSAVVLTLTRDLPRHLEIIFGLPVEIVIKDTRQGSIVLFFGAIIGALGVFSQYKDLVDSFNLIRDQAEYLLSEKLRRFGGYSVRVVKHFPDLNKDRHRSSPFEWEFSQFLLDHIRSSNNELPLARRDMFFWTLFALCIIQFIIIGLLVYGAVVKTYF